MPIQNSLKELYSAFEANMNSAKLFTQLADLKELRGILRSLRPMAIIRDSWGPARQTIKGTLDKVYEVGLPQTVVFVVTCFEYCLKEAYRRLKGSDLTNKQEKSFLQPDVVRLLYGKILKKDVLDGDEKLVRRVEAVIQERHVIVHCAGILDETACSTFEKAGLDRGVVNSELELSPEIVSEDIEYVKTFVKKVFDQIIGEPI